MNENESCGVCHQTNSIIIIIFLHGLGCLTFSGINALSFLIFLGRVTSPSAKPLFLEDQFASLSLLLSYGLSGLGGPTRNI
jgi:hypothetical protein